jgi:hypothetical protein
MNWKYNDATHKSAFRILDVNSFECCLVSALPQGTVIDAPDPPPPPTQNELDVQAALAYPKLAALRTMTPAQVGAWVTNFVNTPAETKDALTTLAVAVCILARRM